MRAGYFPGEGQVALDMLAYFVATTGEWVELSFDYYRDLEYFGNVEASTFTLYVVSCSDGYLEGDRNTDVDEYRIESVGDWESESVRFKPANPHVAIVFASRFLSGWKVGQTCKVKNIEVTKS